MNTVKRWRKSNFQSSQNNPLHHKALWCTMIFSSLIGTYLDLWMVGQGYNAFPNRPFPNIFPIHILFTLLVLPVATVVVISLFRAFTSFIQRGLISLSIFLFIPIFEHVSGLIGVFTHSNDWNHFYSSFGYVIFTFIIWKFYLWMSA
ncbi:CBO0543 family protein [Halobacillus hunanensis]|uniref:CBO0543 family protein n=1 Tax=Halobacillus hunanensis TaxID=578214 RepID=UPI003CCBC728